MAECPHCDRPVEASFRFCPWCAGPLRLKITEFFRGHPGIGSDGGKALRVSRYLAGELPDRHVRFSVWNETGEAEAAVSLDEREALRLARFLAACSARTRPSLRRFLDIARR